MQRRARLARAIGLADALGLDEAAALKARDLMARFDERAEPLRRDVRDAMRTLRDAAQGDSAAAGQVDAALDKLRKSRTQLHTLSGETFAELTRGLSPEKKARAAVFLSSFGHRAAQGGWMQGQGRRGGRGGGPGMGPGAGGMGPGMRGMGPGAGGGMGPGRGGMGPGAGMGQCPLGMGCPCGAMTGGPGPGPSGGAVDDLAPGRTGAGGPLGGPDGEGAGAWFGEEGT